MLSVIADHHDERNNEETYRRFAKRSLVTAWVLIVLAVAADLFLFKSGTYDWGRRYQQGSPGTTQGRNPIE